VNTKEIYQQQLTKGAFGTFRFYGKLRHFGRKGIPEHLDIPEASNSIF